MAQLSTDGGSRPLWAHSGRELFYFDRDGTLMNVPIQTASSLIAGRPVKVFNTHYYPGNGFRAFDIAKDDRRFLMLKDASGNGTSAASIVAVLNWPAELERLVPPK